MLKWIGYPVIGFACFYVTAVLFALLVFLLPEWGSKPFAAAGAFAGVAVAFTFTPRIYRTLAQRLGGAVNDQKE